MADSEAADEAVCAEFLEFNADVADVAADVAEAWAASLATLTGAMALAPAWLTLAIAATFAISRSVRISSMGNSSVRM